MLVRDWPGEKRPPRFPALALLVAALSLSACTLGGQALPTVRPAGAALRPPGHAAPIAAIVGATAGTPPADAPGAAGEISAPANAAHPTAAGPGVIGSANSGDLRPSLAAAGRAEVSLPPVAAKSIKGAPEPGPAVPSKTAGAARQSTEADGEESKEAPLQITRDITYEASAGVDPREQSLDIYAGKGASNRPVVVFIHGGGWSGGDKSEIGEKDDLFAGAGFVFVSINYRLLPSGRHPANVRDVAAALAWLHANVARYGGNPTLVYLIGHSAGAHLAALVSTDERYLAAQNVAATMIKGVVLLDSNAYDIPLLMKRIGGSDNLYTEAFGRSAAEDMTVWRDASPALHINRGKGIPPFLVIHANRDPSRQEQAQDMADRLRAAGIRADLVDIPERDHGSLCDLLGTPGDRATRAILDFYASLPKS